MKDLTIYLANDCHECEEVIEFVKTSDIGIKMTYLEGGELQDSEIFVFPALKRGNKVIAYGVDIINQLNNA